MLNRIVIMGRLVRDPELRKTQSGKSVTSVSVAVDRNKKEDGVDFVDVVAWGATAEFLCKYFSKGSLAVVDGRLQIRNWEDKNGNKRTSPEIVADSIYFGQAKATPAEAKFEEIEDDGTLPF